MKYLDKSEWDWIPGEFEIPEEALDGCQFLIADLSEPDYEMSAYCLFVKDGKLFESEGSHCSCYGFEGQWEPSETSPAALLKKNYISLMGENGIKNLHDIARALAAEGFK